MMTGPEHYKEAERDIARAGRENADTSFHLARAQAHATLALAAATVDAAAFERTTAPPDQCGWVQHSTDVHKVWAEALS